MIGLLRSVTRDKDALRLESEARAVASRRTDGTGVIPIGDVIRVMCLATGGWNQLWMLHPLTAGDTARVITGVAEMRPPSARWHWHTVQGVERS